MKLARDAFSQSNSNGASSGLRTIRFDGEFESRLSSTAKPDGVAEIGTYADAVVYGTHAEDADTVRDVVRRYRAAEPPSATV